MSYASDLMVRTEKKNTEYLIELHKALCLAIETRNWDLVEFITRNVEEYMKAMIIGINVVECE